MKKDLHPQYHKDATITCACGNVITTGSVNAKMQVEICAACHPFFTGEQKLVDTRGRVERFRTRASKATEPKAKKVRVRKEA